MKYRKTWSLVPEVMVMSPPTLEEKINGRGVIYSLGQIDLR